MNGDHIDDGRLAAFVACEIDDGEAAALAEHLDMCPACATRASTLDPLGAAFASVDDPLLPDGLTAAIMEQASLPNRTGPEPAIAAALLGVAIVVLVASGSTTELLSAVATLLSTATTVLGALSVLPSAPAPLWIAVGAMALVLGAATARKLEMRRAA